MVHDPAMKGRDKPAIAAPAPKAAPKQPPPTPKAPPPPPPPAYGGEQLPAAPAKGGGPDKGKGRGKGKSKGEGKQRGRSASRRRDWVDINNPRNLCAQFQVGQCKREQCPYTHQHGNKQEKEELAKLLAAMQSGSRSPSPARGKPICNHWAQTGACPYGEGCQFDHPKGKGKGKDKGKKGKGKSKGK